MSPEVTGRGRVRASLDRRQDVQKGGDIFQAGAAVVNDGYYDGSLDGVDLSPVLPASGLFRVLK